MDINNLAMAGIFKSKLIINSGALLTFALIEVSDFSLDPITFINCKEYSIIHLCMHKKKLSINIINLIINHIYNFRTY